MTTAARLDLGDFLHPALFYQSEQQYLDGLLPFITEGLAADQPVLVAVPGPNLALLREALGPATADIAMADMRDAGRNPGRILGGVLSAFADKHAPRSVRIIGEPIWSGRSHAEYPACVQHEALINNAFAGRDLAVLCPYDVTRLDSTAIADAHITHPVLWQAGLPEQDSVAFAPTAVWEHYNRPLTSGPTAVTYTVNQLADLGGVRQFTAVYGQWFDLPSHITTDLQLIANELATSGLQQNGAPCQLALWQDDGHLICEVSDNGYLDDPLAGRRPYRSDTVRGRGLFVVHGLADLVRIYTTAGQTTIHAYLKLELA
jgi:anti-sigma regulatory factor (Ser/Thr protein kinase)